MSVARASAMPCDQPSCDQPSTTSHSRREWAKGRSVALTATRGAAGLRPLLEGGAIHGGAKAGGRGPRVAFGCPPAARTRSPRSS
eukprot:3075687-Prymnesium_polylepis.2